MGGGWTISGVEKVGVVVSWCRIGGREPVVDGVKLGKNDGS
jgi:hypothetical protein